MKPSMSITDKEMEFASKVGSLRTQENESKQDIADYDTKRFHLTSLQANKLGVVAELAVVKYFGLDPLKQLTDVWPAFYLTEHKDLYDGPDFKFNGVNYEVRRADRKTNPIPIRKKDVATNAIVIQVYVDYEQKSDGRITPSGEVVFLGWSDAAADWDSAQSPAWSYGSSRTVTKKRPMADLMPGGEER